MTVSQSPVGDPTPPAYPPHLTRKLATLATTNPQLHQQITKGKKS